MPANSLLALTRRKVPLDEAQHPLHDNLVLAQVAERCPDDRHLTVQTIDHLRPVPTVDEQLLGLETATHTYLPAIPLRIDHEDARRRHSQMIDVAVPARHPTIVQQDRRRLPRPTLKARGDSQFTLLTSSEGRLFPGTTSRREHMADHRPSLRHVGFAGVPPQLVLARHTGASDPTVQLWQRRAARR